MDQAEWLGGRIRKLRYTRGLTQAQLAHKAGVGEKTLKRLEAGRTSLPRPDTLAAIAGALGLKPEELMADSGGADPAPFPAPAVHQLPRPPQNFTGRAREIEELDQQLASGGVTISGIHGMGGIGKTALALVIADRWSAHFPDGQFYLDLRGASDEPLAPAEAMLHVVRSIDPARPAPKSLPEVEAAYRSTLRGKRALLLMDNAAGREQVEPLLPPPGCVLLVTSRQRFALPGLHAIALAPLAADESRALIGTLAPRAAGVGDALAGLCGGLPLALSLAGRALAERPDIDPAEYAARLADDSDRLRQLDAANATGGVEASFDLSYGMLDAEQQRGLCALAVFPQHFDRAAAAAVWALPAPAADERIGSLLRFHLLESDGAGEAARYRLHDLVRLFAEARLSPEERDRFAMRHARHYLKGLEALEGSARSGDIELSLAIVGREWEHVRAAFDRCLRRANADPEAAELASRVPDAATILRLIQHPRERIAWCEAALALARTRGDRRLEAALLAHAARAHQQLGDSLRALELGEQSLAIAVAESDPRAEAYALVAIGDARHALGEPRQAIAAADRALALARELDARAEEGGALIVLAWAHHVAGESERAVEYAEQTLPIARELDDRGLEAMGLLGLGFALQAIGQPDRARKCAERGLVIARELGDRRIEGYTLLLFGADQIELALEIAREAGDRRLTGNALLYLALARSSRGATHEAIEVLGRALEVAAETSDRALACNARVTLGVTCTLVRDLPKAIDSFQRALEAAVSIGNSRSEAMAAWLLGSAYELHGDLPRAIEAMERALSAQGTARYPFLGQAPERIVMLRARLRTVT